jgi:hypothetical protein
LLLKLSAETLITIAADPKRLGVRIGFVSVLHSCGSALTHHPHVHMIVPGGGFSRDGSKWVSCRPRYLLPVPVLSCLFRRLFLEKLAAAHAAGQLKFFGSHVRLANAQAFAAYLAPLRNSKWVLYCKRPFGGPKQVLRYLARYTHRVAISNRRCTLGIPFLTRRTCRRPSESSIWCHCRSHTSEARNPCRYATRIGARYLARVLTGPISY